MTVNADSEQIFAAVGEAIATRLPRNQRVRRNLPGKGRVRIDRQLPFLCAYRIPVGRKDDGARELVTTEAAYLVAPGDAKYAEQVTQLCTTISTVMLEHFGRFLIFEFWTDVTLNDSAPLPGPAFRIHVPDTAQLERPLNALNKRLNAIKISGLPASVEIVTTEPVHPPDLPPLLELTPTGCFTLGIAVAPFFRNKITGAIFPLLMQQLRRQLAQAVRVSVASFAASRDRTTSPHFQTYGPTSMVRAARRADQELSEFSETFDFLLQVTPINSEAAWQEFQENHFSVRPTLRYRPLPYDPNLLKRRLFEIPIERVEDPTLAHLFWEKQTELDRQLSALRDLNQPAFLHHSLQIYGGVEDDLAELAREILRQECAPGKESEDGRISASEVAEAARDEIDYYHQRCPAFHATVEVRDDITSGLMVSRGKLLISPQLTLRPERLQPLLDHEVGTHLVTYANGRQQPFRLLALGLAGYEALQEGLAVLAEYLATGLTAGRLRLLAGRVLAVQSLIEGADFIETFRWLHDEFHFLPRSAFITSLRAHRSGGLTKDAVYLRGLHELLTYLHGGHEIEPLYVGKIALEHILYMQELRRRRIIDPPAVLPRFWTDPNLKERLNACRSQTVLDMLKEPSP